MNQQMPIPNWIAYRLYKADREKRLVAQPEFRQRVAFADNRKKLKERYKERAEFYHEQRAALSKWKGAMRFAIKDEIAAFKRKKTLDVLAGGQLELARLYQLPGRHVDAYQVGHKTAFVQLLSLFLLEKKLCWEDLSLGENCLLSDPEQIDSWTAWHQSYSETYDNLFVLSKVQNNTASKRWVMMPSRQFGAF